MASLISPAEIQDPDSPSVSIVIPTWNGRHLLQQFLPSVITAAESYQDSARTDVEVIIVDDGSTDGTAPWLEATYPQVLLVTNHVNEGFAPACNHGFARATHPVILLLNNDVKVEPNVLLPLVDHFSDPTVFAVCCKAIDPGTGGVATAGKVGEFKHGFWRVHGNYDVVSGQSSESATRHRYHSILASGGFSAFATEKLRELGGFNPLLTPFYWEDVDLSLRAWKRGWSILYEPRAIVYHAAGSTIGLHFAPRHVEAVAQRNRFIMHWVNLHDCAWLVEHMMVVVLLLLSSVLRLNLSIWRAFIGALGRLPEIWRQRQQERRAAKVTDRELAELMAAAIRRSDVRLL